MAYLAMLALAVVSAMACHWLAARRGGHVVFWTAMGLLFGPLAIPFVFLGRRRPDIR